MDYELDYAFNEDRKTWEVKLAGEVDIFNSDRFKDAVISLISDKPADVTVDCGGLNYIDSTALGALVALHKAALQAGRSITLVNLSANIRRLLKITNLENIFTRAE
jgi:anti-sigma B factor antagonist